MDNATPTGQGTNSDSGHAPGSYTIEVTDQNATTDSVTIDVLSLPGPDLTVALYGSVVIRGACPRVRANA